REDQDLEIGVGGAEFDGGAQSLVGVGGRHADVGDDDVGTALDDGRLEGGGVGDGGRHLVALVLQQLHQAGPQDRGVLGDDDAHQSSRFCVGTDTVTVVGPPGGLEMSSTPSVVRTRSERPRRPLPVPSAVAPPTPLSVTTSMMVSPSVTTVIATAEA